MEVAVAARHAAQGQRIRAARKAAGLTEQELSDQLQSVTATTVSNWERGSTQPLYWLRPKLAIALGVPYFRLFIPEEVADHMHLGARRLLLTAHRLRGHSENWFVETGHGAERTNANWLCKDWLIEDAGNGPRKSRVWQLTNPGLDVLQVLRLEQP